MVLKPTITFDQYCSVILAVRSIEPTVKKNQWVGMLIGVAIGLVLVTLFEHQPTRESAYVLGLLFILYVTLCKPFFRNRYKAALRISFEQQTELLNGNVMTVSDKGIAGSFIGGTAEYRYQWQSFATYIDRPEDFLFLYAPCCWVRIPKEDLTEENQKSILAWYKAAHGQPVS